MGGGKQRVVGAALAAVAALAVLVSACGGGGSPAPAGDYTLDHPRLSEAQATELAQEALEGWAACDYGRFSTSWDDAMRAAINEDAFKGFCAAYHASHGSFVKIESIEKTAAKTDGHVKWVVRTTFEKGQVTYSFVLRIDGDRVVGSVFDPPA